MFVSLHKNIYAPVAQLVDAALSKGVCSPFESGLGYQTWKVNQAGPDSVLKTEGVRKRIEFDSTSLPPNLYRFRSMDRTTFF